MHTTSAGRIRISCRRYSVKPHVRPKPNNYGIINTAVNYATQENARNLTQLKVRTKNLTKKYFNSYIEKNKTFAIMHFSAFEEKMHNNIMVRAFFILLKPLNWLG